MLRSAFAACMAVFLAAFPSATVLNAQSNSLSIEITQGDGALNDVRRSVASDINLLVRDQRGLPVSGAHVALTAPSFGPGVTFPGGGRIWTGTSDEQGRLEVAGISPNKLEGRFLIRATANYEAREGSAVIVQTNTLAAGVSAEERGKSKKKIWILLGIAAGAAVGAGVAFSGGGSGGASAAVVPPPSLSITTVTVGGPR